MYKDLYIITGTNKGLGKALVDEVFLLDNSSIISIGRTLNEDHVKFLNTLSDRFHFIKIDLNQPALLAEKIDSYHEIMQRTDRIIFINNAGTIAPIEKIGCINSTKLLASININSASPAIITNRMLNKLSGKKLVFINITSGAAKRPIDGWAAYCASKSYAKMFFDVLAEQTKDNPRIKVYQIDPGMMDTEMQHEIRSSNPEIFPQVSEFVSVKENGKLKSAKDVAKSIISEIVLL